MIIIVADDDNADVFNGVKSKMGVVHKAGRKPHWLSTVSRTAGLLKAEVVK